MNSEKNIEKAKIIIICGQSNAAGVARHSYLEKTVGKERKEKLEKGFENIRIAYHCGGLGPSEEPFRQIPDRGSANVSNGFEKLSFSCGSHRNKEFFGPELGIAEYLSERFPEEEFYIVKHSYGGSTIGDYLPNDPLANFVGDEVEDKRDIIALDSYGELRELFDDSVKDIETEKGKSCQVVAICWMQGEAEGGCGAHFASTYKRREETLINNFRRDYKAYAPENGIAFISAGINDSGVWPSHEVINNAKKEIAEECAVNYFIDTAAEGLSCLGEPVEGPDIYHYDSDSMLKLGRLFGEKIEEYLKQ